MNEPGAINWERIHRRIEMARSIAEGRISPSPESVRTILQRRAEELSREPPAESKSERLEILEFMLGNERYAIASNYVREVIPLKEFTPLPGTPGFVLGIINVRGQIYSITNIRIFFGLAGNELTNSNHVILIENNVMEFGLLADAILGSRSVDLIDIKAPKTFPGIHHKYVHGLCSGPTLLLNATALLTDPELVVQEGSRLK